ncbi:hypothetical protein FRC00_013951 [Tulasnella sp. 408]|nr:hypothetical protein FRC00_013951 [Tulasnella sp. 408]
MNEAKQTVVSQEQLESMVKFDESSNTVDKIDGEEGTAGDGRDHLGDQLNSESANTSNSEVRASSRLPDVANFEQASSPALAQSQLPIVNDGRRNLDDAQPSPPSREASPARTDTGSNLTYDDGVQDDGQDMGGTSAGVRDVAVWNILISSSLTHRRVPSRIRNKAARLPPAPPQAANAKRNTPSTGSDERPATKYRRPGFEAEDEPSPLPQSRVRNSRRDLVSTPWLPLRRWHTDPSLRSGPSLKARSMVDGIPLRDLRPLDSVPEEEATEVAGSNSLGMASDRAGDTEDDRRETEPQLDQSPIHVDIEPPRFLPKQRRSERRRGNVGMVLAVQFALDVPSLALLVHPSTSSVRPVVDESRELGVEAEAVEPAEAAKGRTDLVSSASPIPPTSSTTSPAPAESTNGTEQTSSSETPRLIISNLTDTRGLDFPSLTQVSVVGIDVVKIPSDYTHIAGRVGRFGKGDHVITFVEDGSAGEEAAGASGADEGRMKRLYRKLDINPAFVEIESM